MKRSHIHSQKHILPPFPLSLSPSNISSHPFLPSNPNSSLSLSLSLSQTQLSQCTKSKETNNKEKLQTEKNGGEGRSGRETNQASDDMHDRSWWLHWLPPLRKAHGGDAAQGVGSRCLQRQDQAPSRARGRSPLVRSHSVSPPQHQERLSPRRPHQDVRSG